MSLISLDGPYNSSCTSSLFHSSDGDLGSALEDVAVACGP